jgi:hypothetical protein
VAIFSQPQTVKVWSWVLQAWIMIGVEGSVFGAEIDGRVVQRLMD